MLKQHLNASTVHHVNNTDKINNTGNACYTKLKKSSPILPYYSVSYSHDHILKYYESNPNKYGI